MTMLVKRFCAVASAIIVLSLPTAVRGAEKYFNVGLDTFGDPFLLDTTTMGEKDKKFGSVIKIYQIKNNLFMYEYILRPSCSDARIWAVGHRVYNINSGKKITEEKEDREIPNRGDNPGSTALKYYCQAIKARGW
ncbi:MAG: hypothetical protein RMZ41_029035 [Nostoc sp. DedVER02]|uniref:hypothetical protein n=2 Tax=unclassified Nostoc TaxID=2593658 RepID=UPI002AD2F3FF|nr:hypothetical protein [Nostoc sp. DedVER02]MDZ7989836.1 hypothetical protein [Nostoc sp. DedVER02]MDZ8111249.1 hypothetical protein [Nostoc sp. DedVER01b]